MHDTLHYMSEDPVHRKYHHHELTFGLIYAFTENFILPLSPRRSRARQGLAAGKMPATAGRALGELVGTTPAQVPLQQQVVPWPPPCQEHSSTSTPQHLDRGHSPTSIIVSSGATNHRAHALQRRRTHYNYRRPPRTLATRATPSSSTSTARHRARRWAVARTKNL